MASTKAIGKKLLSQMGWKEGQGLGPRVKSKHSTIVPAGVNMSTIPSAANMEGVVTLAPDNTKKEITVPIAKSDMHGIGYIKCSLSNLEVGSSSTGQGRGVYRMDASVLNGSWVGNTTKRTLGSTAVNSFGLSRDSAGFAYDDDADDVYDDSLAVSRKSQIEEVPNEIQEVAVSNVSKHSLDSAMDKFVGEGTAEKISQRCLSDNRVVLEGFTLSTALREAPLEYPAIIVPEGYAAHHIFPDGRDKEGKRNQTLKAKLDGVEFRAKLLHPEAISSTTRNASNSVFDLLDDRGREKIKEVLQKSGGSMNSFATEATAGLRTSSKTKEHSDRPMLVSVAASASVFSGVSAAFKSRFTSASGEMLSKSENEEAVEGLWKIDRKPSTTGAGNSSSASTDPVSAISNHRSGSMSTKVDSVRVGSSKRGTEIWKPQPLLCKRMGVSIPEISKELPRHGQPLASDRQHRQETSHSSRKIPTGVDGSIPSREDELYHKHIGQHILGQTLESSDKVKDLEPIFREKGDEDDNIEDRKPKPPISLFKSIFEPDDSSSSDSDNEDVEKDSKKGTISSLHGSSFPDSEINEPSEFIQDQAANPLPSKIVFKRPSSNKAGSKDNTEKTRESSNDLWVRNRSNISMNRRGAGILSFSDDIELISSDIADKIPLRNVRSHESTDTSSSSEDNSSTNGEENTTFFPKSTNDMFSDDADRVKAKLQSILSDDARNKKHHKSRKKEKKKNKKEKKHKKESSRKKSHSSRKK